MKKKEKKEPAFHQATNSLGPGLGLGLLDPFLLRWGLLWAEGRLLGRLLDRAEGRLLGRLLDRCAWYILCRAQFHPNNNHHPHHPLPRVLGGYR